MKRASDHDPSRVQSFGQVIVYSLLLSGLCAALVFMGDERVLRVHMQSAFQASFVFYVSYGLGVWLRIKGFLTPDGHLKNLVRDKNLDLQHEGAPRGQAKASRSVVIFQHWEVICVLLAQTILSLGLVTLVGIPMQGAPILAGVMMIGGLVFWANRLPKDPRSQLMTST